MKQTLIVEDQHVPNAQLAKLALKTLIVLPTFVLQTLVVRTHDECKIYKC